MFYRYLQPTPDSSYIHLGKNIFLKKNTFLKYIILELYISTVFKLIIGSSTVKYLREREETKKK